MKRILLTCLAALIAITLSIVPALAADTTRPNLVLFLADDLGYDFTGCYGNKVVQTPHLDALAREGMKFTEAFAASPTCSPSRAALLTGLYPQRNGTMGNHTDCHPDVKSLPAFLKPLGYRIVAADKTDVRPRSVFPWETLRAELPKNPALDRRYRGEGLDTAQIETLLADHEKTHPGQPLCLLIGENCPHVVWEKNKIYDPAKLPIPPFIVDTPKTRTALANYYQDITTMDRHLGDVLASLERHGFATNTLFLFTADQGPEWPHCKWTCYDTGLRVPFIVRWPGSVTPGSVSKALLSLIDITATFVDAAGGAVPPDLDAHSFKDVLLGKAATHRTEIFATHTGDGTFNMFPQRCARNTRYKFILNLNPERTWTTHFTKVDGIADSHKEVWDTWVDKAKNDASTARLVNVIEHHAAEELYDTQTDPYELNNLAARPELKPVLDKLRANLAQWREQVGDKEGAK